MPTCPGCHERVSYDRLATHARYCPDIAGDEGVAGESVERLARRLEAVEARLDDRVSTIEETLREESGLAFKKPSK